DPGRPESGSTSAQLAGTNAPPTVSCWQGLFAPETWAGSPAPNRMAHVPTADRRATKDARGLDGFSAFSTSRVSATVPSWLATVMVQWPCTLIPSPGPPAEAA